VKVLSLPTGEKELELKDEAYHEVPEGRQGQIVVIGFRDSDFKVEGEGDEVPDDAEGERGDGDGVGNVLIISSLLDHSQDRVHKDHADGGNEEGIV